MISCPCCVRTFIDTECHKTYPGDVQRDPRSPPLSSNRHPKNPRDLLPNPLRHLRQSAKTLLQGRLYRNLPRREGIPSTFPLANIPYSVLEPRATVGHPRLLRLQQSHLFCPLEALGGSLRATRLNSLKFPWMISRLPLTFPRSLLIMIKRSIHL